MRKRRQDTLDNTGLFHKMWRGHNREPVLQALEDKADYLKHLNDTLVDPLTDQVSWFSFCLMTNHAHETGAVAADDDGDFSDGITALGTWMRNAHSRFGQRFNRRYDRQGKVAYDRPKTTEIDDDQGVLTTMFYGDANPVRAGMVSHPSRYQHSSHRYYAYGESSAATEGLTPPPAYQRLGRTATERQKKYRQRCDQYLRRVGLIDDRPEEGEEPEPAGNSETKSEGFDLETVLANLRWNEAHPDDVIPIPMTEDFDFEAVFGSFDRAPEGWEPEG